MSVGQQTGGVTGPKNGAATPYVWYAGNLSIDPNNSVVGTPIEFGAINLSSSDPIKPQQQGRDRRADYRAARLDVGRGRLVARVGDR